MIIVCPAATPEGYKRFAFGGYYKFSPSINIVLIAGNNALELTNLDVWLNYRQQISDALNALNPTNILASRIVYDVPLEREQINDNYDYLSMNYSCDLWRHS